MSGSSSQESDTTARARREIRRERYEEHTDLPLMVLAIAVIPLVAVELTGLSDRAQQGVNITYWLIWGAFSPTI